MLDGECILVADITKHGKHNIGKSVRTSLSHHQRTFLQSIGLALYCLSWRIPQCLILFLVRQTSPGRQETALSV